jgi:subtilisin-like proprotein convertase family protein
MKTILPLATIHGLFLASVLPASASLFTTNWSIGFVNGTAIPDGNLAGWSDTRNLSGLSGTIQDISVRLDVSTTWNGDLYAYLTHGSGHTVLLNRVGMPGAPNGYSDDGFAVTFSDGGTAGLHNYQTAGYPGSLNGNGQVTGTWQPDGVGFVAGNFIGLDPNGSWSLFIVDYNSGDLATVTSWGLDLNIVAVPEVETWVAAALAGMFGAFWLNRQIWGSKS